MIELTLIGMGSGNPDHVTRQAIAALQSADLILIPEKGEEKSDLVELRHAICAEALADDLSRVAGFTLPVRDEATPDYITRVDDWHDAIAVVWEHEIRSRLGTGGRVAFLVWGDPSLYDSTLRIAERVKARMPLTVRVVPGITSLQALTAAHAIPLNDLGAPFIVTTGRRLRDEGWPPTRLWHPAQAGMPGCLWMWRLPCLQARQKNDDACWMLHCTIKPKFAIQYHHHSPRAQRLILTPCRSQPHPRKQWTNVVPNGTRSIPACPEPQQAQVRNCLNKPEPRMD